MNWQDDLYAFTGPLTV